MQWKKRVCAQDPWKRHRRLLISFLCVCTLLRFVITCSSVSLLHGIRIACALLRLQLFSSVCFFNFCIKGNLWSFTRTFITIVNCLAFFFAAFYVIFFSNMILWSASELMPWQNSSIQTQCERNNCIWFWMFLKYQLEIDFWTKMLMFFIYSSARAHAPSN